MESPYVGGAADEAVRRLPRGLDADSPIPKSSNNAPAPTRLFFLGTTQPQLGSPFGALVPNPSGTPGGDVARPALPPAPLLPATPLAAPVPPPPRLPSPPAVPTVPLAPLIPPSPFTRPASFA